MSKSRQFHVSSDFATKTIRFHYCGPSDATPTKALCYCVSTQAWWQEEYPAAVTASCESLVGDQYRTLTSASGFFYRQGGVTDPGGAGVAYRMRSGNMALTDSRDQSRTFSVVYRPTAEDSNLNLRLYYNNSDTPRPNAIASDLGGGFNTSGGTQTTLNMKRTRSALGDASGAARAYFTGRNDPKSAGADRHVAIEMAGTQAGTTASAVVIHGIAVDGVD
jgi:hypothetical protein